MGDFGMRLSGSFVGGARLQFVFFVAYVLGAQMQQWLSIFNVVHIQLSLVAVECWCRGYIIHCSPGRLYRTSTVQNTCLRSRPCFIERRIFHTNYGNFAIIVCGSTCPKHSTYFGHSVAVKSFFPTMLTPYKEFRANLYLA